MNVFFFFFFLHGFRPSVQKPSKASASWGSRGNTGALGGGGGEGNEHISSSSHLMYQKPIISFYSDSLIVFAPAQGRTEHLSPY